MVLNCFSTTSEKLSGVYNTKTVAVDMASGGATAGVFYGIGALVRNIKAGKPAANTSRTTAIKGKGSVETTRVGRLMSKAEHDKIVETGSVQESFSSTTHVANPADVNAFAKQAKPGSIYVEFDVPISSVKPTGNGWAKIVGPNSLEGRLAAKKGLPIPKMPSATNIEIVGGN